MMPVLLLAAVIACLAGPSAAYHDLQEQLIPPMVPDTDWRSLMQLPLDLQELAAASPEAGSYGYGGTKESSYGSSISESSSAADAAAGWRRMLLQQADAAFAPLLQPGSYSYSSSTDIDGSHGGSPAALAEAAAAGSYGKATVDPVGSMRKLLQQIYSTAGGYGSANAFPAGSYENAVVATEAGVYGSMRRLLQDSTDATGSYGDAAAPTDEGVYGGLRRLLQDSTNAAGSCGDAAAATDKGLYGSVRRLLQDSNGAAGSYGDAAATTDNGLYGGLRRLLQDSDGAAGSAADTAALTDSSDSHVVLVVDVPDAFNKEDNTLALSFSGAWTPTGSSSFSAAFRLELLDASGTEVLTFESPTLHHRTLSRPQLQQQHKPILLNYTTIFNDVQLVPGQQATLRMTTQDSSVQGFQASIRLFWQQQQQQQDGVDSPPVFEHATPGAYGESKSPGEYGADTDAVALLAAAAAEADALDTILPEAPEILSREQLPYVAPAPVDITSSSSSSMDDTLAPAPIMDPTDPAAPLDIREAPVGFVDPPTLADAAGTAPAGQDSSNTNVLVTQPVVAPDEVMPSALAAPEVITDVPADASAVPTATDADSDAPTAATGVGGLTAVEGVTPAAAQGAPSAASSESPLDVPAVVVEVPPAPADAAVPAPADAAPAVDAPAAPAAVDAAFDSTPAAATAAGSSAKRPDHQKPAMSASPASGDAKTKPNPAAGARPHVHLAKPGRLRGPHMPEAAATAVTTAAGPVIDSSPQQTADAQTLPVAPAMPPVGLAEGQVLQPMVAAAVPLPSDAFSGSFSDGTTDSTGLTTAADFGCRRKIPRGLQCGGTGGHCAEASQSVVFGTAGSVSACKDEPFVDACCAPGTVCARKSEALWVCAPGHGFLRRMLA